MVWSDITHPESLTSASGSLFVEAGVAGGDGGRIETSGAELEIAGINVSTEFGDHGLWLLDPTDFIIGVDAALAIVTALENDNDVTVLVGGGSCSASYATSTCTDGTSINGGGLSSSLPGGGSDDRIIVDNLIFASTSSSVKLTLDAPGGVVLNKAVEIIPARTWFKPKPFRLLSQQRND